MMLVVIDTNVWVSAFLNRKVFPARIKDMPREIKESDWKLFRRLHPVALERFCKQVIEEINQATSTCAEDCHKRYLGLFHLIKTRDKEMGRAFDECAGLRRLSC